MPVPIGQDGFMGPNSPARLGRKHKEMVESTCPNHEYRSCAKRMGQRTGFCRLCLNQQEMAERWRNIRKAFVIIRSSTRKRSADRKPAVIPQSGTQWKISIAGPLCPATAVKGMQVVIAVDFGSG
jgi:hypothetical protein